MLSDARRGYRDQRSAIAPATTAGIERRDLLESQFQSLLSLSVYVDRKQVWILQHRSKACTGAVEDECDLCVMVVHARDYTTRGGTMAVLDQPNLRRREPVLAGVFLIQPAKYVR